MVYGVTLLHGLNVPKCVVEVVKYEAEPAATQLQLTVELNVKEAQKKLKTVSPNLVQVQCTVLYQCTSRKSTLSGDTFSSKQHIQREE